MLRLSWLRWQKQFIQREKFIQNFIFAVFHLFDSAKKTGSAIVQENDPVCEFLRESHIVRDDNASEMQL